LGAPGPTGAESFNPPLARPSRMMLPEGASSKDRAAGGVGKSVSGEPERKSDPRAAPEALPPGTLDVGNFCDCVEPMMKKVPSD